MSAPDASVSPARYALLDHWRGFAALAVVLYHATNHWPIHPPPAGLGWFAALTERGWLGVHLFFVISGYCVAQLALREIRRGRSVGNFLRHRLLRIYPAYWAACLLAAAIALAAVPFNHTPVFDADGASGALPGSLASAARHALLINPYPDYLLVAWTLAWEVAYYLMAAGLLLVALTLGLRVALGAGLLLAVGGLFPTVVAFWPALGGWTEFACGACVFAALTARADGRAAWPWLTSIALLGVGGIAVVSPGISPPFAAGFALLLFFLHPYDARLARLRLFAWLGGIGVMSYSLYLVHLPAMSRVRNLVGRVLPDTTTVDLGIVALNLTLSLATAWLFHRWVEAPAERWRRAQLAPAPVPAVA